MILFVSRILEMFTCLKLGCASNEIWLWWTANIIRNWLVCRVLQIVPPTSWLCIPAKHLSPSPAGNIDECFTTRGKTWKTFLSKNFLPTLVFIAKQTSCAKLEYFFCFLCLNKLFISLQIGLHIIFQTNQKIKSDFNIFQHITGIFFKLHFSL